MRRIHKSTAFPSKIPQVTLWGEGKKDSSFPGSSKKPEIGCLPPYAPQRDSFSSPTTVPVSGRAWSTHWVLWADVVVMILASRRYSQMVPGQGKAENWCELVCSPCHNMLPAICVPAASLPNSMLKKFIKIHCKGLLATHPRGKPVCFLFGVPGTCVMSTWNYFLFQLTHTSLKDEAPGSTFKQKNCRWKTSNSKKRYWDSLYDSNTSLAYNHSIFNYMIATYFFLQTGLLPH